MPSSLQQLTGDSPSAISISGWFSMLSKCKIHQDLLLLPWPNVDFGQPCKYSTPGGKEFQLMHERIIGPNLKL